MSTLRLYRKAPALAHRVLAYLDCLREPCHYLLLADILHCDADKVQGACWHLARTGRLAHVGVGRYAIVGLEPTTPTTERHL